LEYSFSGEKGEQTGTTKRVKKGKKTKRKYTAEFVMFENKWGFHRICHTTSPAMSRVGGGGGRKLETLKRIIKKKKTSWAKRVICGNKTKKRNGKEYRAQKSDKTQEALNGGRRVEATRGRQPRRETQGSKKKS